MRVLVVSDRFDGTLTAPAAAAAVAAGWRRVRPDDDVSTLPLSTGGAGLCEVLAREGDRWLDVEVVGPHGRPVDARALLRGDGIGVIEAAAACGPGLAPPGQDDPRSATTFGVGQLLRAVIDAGAGRVLVGSGDCVALDAGLGALTGLGYRLRVADGSGLKIGGGEIGRLDRIEQGWAPAISGVDIELLTDTWATLTEAADRRAEGDPEVAATIAEWRSSFAQVGRVLARDLPGAGGNLERPGTAGGGGLGAALHAALGVELVPGAARVGGLLGLEGALAATEVVVVAQEALDAAEDGISVLGTLRRVSGSRAGTPQLAVARHLGDGERAEVDDAEAVVETAVDPGLADGLAEAAARLAARR